MEEKTTEELKKDADFLLQMESEQLKKEQAEARSNLIKELEAKMEEANEEEAAAIAKQLESLEKEHNSNVEDSTTEVTEEFNSSDLDVEEMDRVQERVSKVRATKKKGSARKTHYQDDLIIPLGDELEVETEQSMFYDAYVRLEESKKLKRTLTGTIAGSRVLTMNGHDVPCTIIYYGDFEVLIPVDEMGIEFPAEIRGNEREVLTYKKMLMDMRLAAEVQFVVIEANLDAKLAIASRRQAMQITRRNYYLTQNRQMEFPLNQGDLVECRIVAVSSLGIWVEIYGVEVFIPQNEISYRRVADVTKDFSVGQHVIAKITLLERKPTGKKNGRTTYSLKVNASLKQAKKNPQIALFERYKIKDRIYGMVTGVTEYGVYVRLGGKDGQIDCLCKAPDLGTNPIKGSMVLVIITHKDIEQTRIFGNIIHVIKL